MIIIGIKFQHTLKKKNNENSANSLNIKQIRIFKVENGKKIVVQQFTGSNLLVKSIDHLFVGRFKIPRLAILNCCVGVSFM